MNDNTSKEHTRQDMYEAFVHGCDQGSYKAISFEAWMGEHYPKNILKDDKPNRTDYEWLNFLYVCNTFEGWLKKHNSKSMTFEKAKELAVEWSTLKTNKEQVLFVHRNPEFEFRLDNDVTYVGLYGVDFAEEKNEEIHDLMKDTRMHEFLGSDPGVYFLLELLGCTAYGV